MTPIEQALNYPFASPQLLEQALTHPSVNQGSHSPIPHNQRMEFLGDAVLQLLCTQHLYELHKQEPEGALTQRRAGFVNRTTLASLARRIEIPLHLRLGRSEEEGGGRERDSILADSLEAVLGAIFLDGGWEAANRVAAHLLIPFWQTAAHIHLSNNPKGQLQETLQSRHPEAPSYQLISQEGPDHRRTFCVEVVWQGKTLAQGSGHSKKEAEIQAAQNALQAIDL